MLIVAGTVRIRPDQRDAAVHQARQMAQATQSEAGCLAYTFSADLTDPALFHVFEAWQGEAALAEHFRTPHMAEFNRHLPDLIASAPQLRRYSVASVQPL